VILYQEYTGLSWMLPTQWEPMIFEVLMAENNKLQSSRIWHGVVW
jgi:hypothetical protein